MDPSTFFDQLRDSRLFDEPQLEFFADRFAGAAADAVSRTLVTEGHLTAFQADQLQSGQGRGLALGQYRLVDVIGEGGFGRVYRAVHTLMGRTVALKVLAPHFADHRRARDWFLREVVATTRLDHPNIVTAHDANEADGVLYLVMEYVEGVDLETLVRRRGPLPIGTAIEMLRQCGLALQHAHERGTVHRDIKPANLLVPHAGPAAVKVGDFGLARLLDGARHRPSLGQSQGGFLGSPDYVAPEQARDAHDADIRSDLYSLGCTFYFALTGERPFKGDSVFEVVLKHLEQAAPPLKALRPEVPDALAALVQRMMAKAPGRRFQTPSELVAELTFLCRPEANKPRGPRPRVLPPPPREPAGVCVAPRVAPPPAPAGQPEVPALLPVDAAFWRDWAAWTGLIAACLKGDEPRLPPGQDYRSLHAGLLRVCRSRGAAGDEEERPLFRRLEALLEPWVSPQSLTATDRATLVSLWDDVRRAEAALGRRGAGRTRRGLALALAVLLTLALGWLLPHFQTPGGLSGAVRAAANSLKRNPLVGAAGGLGVVFVGSWLWRRSLHS